MGLRINAGYIITDSLHVGDAEFVLGVSQHIPNDFVTWRCFNGNYYWGHYYSNLVSAQKDLVERAAERVAEIQDVLNSKEVMEPGYSPWGKVQSCTTLCDGVFSVVTESHGGIMVHQIVAGNVLSGAAIKCGFADGSYLCFEEDCDAQVVIRELMDRKLYQAPVNEHFPPGKFESVIDASVQRNHPEYWSFRKRHLLPALQNKQHKSNKERER